MRTYLGSSTSSNRAHCALPLDLLRTRARESSTPSASSGTNQSSFCPAAELTPIPTKTCSPQPQLKMSDPNPICDFCRTNLVNLAALGAYFNFPLHSTRFNQHAHQKPHGPIVPLINTAPGLPLQRPLADFAPQCPVCQLILAALELEPDPDDGAASTTVRLCARMGDVFSNKYLRGILAIATRLVRGRQFFPVAVLDAKTRRPRPYMYGAGLYGPGMYGPRRHGAELHASGFDDSEIRPVVRVFIDPEDDANRKLAKHIAGRPVCDPQSDFSRRRIRAWLDACVASHVHCRTGLSGVVRDDRTADSALPRRLIPRR